MSRPNPGRRRLSLGLIGLAAMLSLAVFDQLSQVPSLEAIETPPLAAVPAQRLESQWDTGVPPLEALRETLSRPLFLASRRAPEPEAAAAPPPPKAEPLDYGLIGVTLFDGRRVALVRPRNGGRVLRVTEGARLGQWRVTAIAPKRLEVRSAGLVGELKLEDAKRPVVRAGTRREPKAEPVSAPPEDQRATKAAVK